MYVVQKDSEATKNHLNIELNVSGKNVRMYANPSNNLCPVVSFQKYLRKRNPKCPAFFQGPRDTFHGTDAIWYENKPLGKIGLGHMMIGLSKAADLSVIYSNH